MSNHLTGKSKDEQTNEDKGINQRLVDREEWGLVSTPLYVHTVGLHTEKLPEFIIMGLPTSIAEHLLNDLTAKTISESTKYKHGQVIKQIANTPLIAIKVSEDNKNKYAKQAYNYYFNWKFKLLQLVYPDKAGIYPWESGYDETQRATQPILGKIPLTLKT